MRLNKFLKKSKPKLINLILQSLFEVVVVYQIIRLQIKINKVTPLLLLLYVILIMIIPLLVGQWVIWLKQYKNSERTYTE